MRRFLPLLIAFLLSGTAYAESSDPYTPPDNTGTEAAESDENAYERYRRMSRQRRSNLRSRRQRFSEVSLPRKGYGTAGCGLGGMIFGTKKGGVQILAATTNQSSGNQTFAISSGTSRCGAYRPRSVWTAAFIEANRHTIATDAARGAGESLQGLAHMMGCAPAADFARQLKKRFGDIFGDGPENGEQIAESIRRAMAGTRDVSCGEETG